MRNSLGIAAVGAAAMMLGACGGNANNSASADNAVQANQAETASITGLDGPWPGGLPAYPGATLREPPAGVRMREGCVYIMFNAPGSSAQVIAFYQPILERAGFTKQYELGPFRRGNSDSGARVAFSGFSGPPEGPMLISGAVCRDGLAPDILP